MERLTESEKMPNSKKVPNSCIGLFRHKVRQEALLQASSAMREIFHLVTVEIGRKRFSVMLLEVEKQWSS